MIPYIEIPSLEITEQIQLHPFGFLVGSAIIVGTSLFTRRTRDLGLDERVAADLALWAVVPGFIVAHLYSIIFYFPERVVEDPLVLLKFWDGISSFGGFIGGTLGVIYYLKRHRIPVLPYAEALTWAFTIAWILGRMGCTIAHDHPGLPTTFFLAPNFPTTADFPAGPRHDLGFYEFLWALVMGGFFYLQRHKTRFAGWHIAVVLICYTPVRFLFDYLRTADEKYLGLTPGQYGAIGFFVLAVFIYALQSRSDHVLVPNGEIHVLPDGKPAYQPQPATGSTSRSGAGNKSKGRKKKR